VLGILSATGSMLYRAPDGTVTEITTTGQPLGNALMVGAGGVPVWGEGSDTLAVRNESGSPMTKGQVVRISGFSVGEDLPTVVLAQADSAVNARAVAMLAEDIADNANGSAVITGIIDHLHWLDPSRFRWHQRLNPGQSRR
jgi:hypothetical protein